LRAAIPAGTAQQRSVTVRAMSPNAAPIEFTASARLDTPQEQEYYRHGGILQFVLRQLLGTA
jgi:aconitate hydratase